VLWDQAESDSFPQTPFEYYGCQTVAHISSWRKVFGAELPWIFVHLQPYTGAFNLEHLRSSQLQGLGLPLTGYASAMDLGDSHSPFGNVHFQNKQAISKRVVGAALRVAFGISRGTDAETNYPAPEFFSQTVLTTASAFNADISFNSDVTFKLMFASTADLSPLAEANASSAICPPLVQALINCSSFEIMLDDGTGNVTYVPAVPAMGLTNTLRLTAQRPASLPNAYAVGSAYGWGDWPLATLFVQTLNGEQGLPILPWSQALTMIKPNFTSTSN